MNILRAEAYVKQYVPQSTKLADVYDDDEMMSAAMLTLFPEFEYPDFSHLTLREVMQRYAKNPRSLAGTAPDASGQPRLPHYSELTHRGLRPGMSSAEVNELGAHCHAAWRSEFNGVPIRLYRLEAGGSFTYYMRTQAEDFASAEPMPLTAFVALYVNGRAEVRVDSPFLAVLDERLGDLIGPLNPRTSTVTFNL